MAFFVFREKNLWILLDKRGKCCIIKMLIVSILIIRKQINGSVKPERRESVQLKEKQVIFGPRGITHQMIMTIQMHRRMLEKNVEGTGIHRAQHRLLMTLSDNHFLSQVELARHLGVTAATIAVSLKAMEKEGLISRKAKHEDNRVNFVELTERGKQIAKQSKAYFEALDEQMYQGFTGEEREQLSEFLDRIYNNLEQMDKQHKRNGGKNATI